jgi:hypothetical protein
MIGPLSKLAFDFNLRRHAVDDFLDDFVLRRRKNKPKSYGLVTNDDDDSNGRNDSPDATPLERERG